MKLDLGGQLQEVASVSAGHVGDAADLALAPQQTVVIELRHAIEVDRVDGDDTAFAQAGQRSHYYISAGSEGDGAVEFDGRLVGFASDPFRAQRLGQATMRQT